MTGLVIGSLRHRARLEAPVRTQADGGTATIDWTNAGELYCRIEPRTGSEIVEADGRTARVSHRVLLRHRPDISPQMRFRVGTRVLEIRTVIEADRRGRWLQCLCEEKLP